MPFRFVHTADLHLDSPLRSLALRNEELAGIVRGATRNALVRIVDLCIAEGVDALLIAGDLYDGNQTSMNTALFLAGELRRLDEAGIRTFIIRGNHDAQSQVTRELTLPPSVHVFPGRGKPVLAKTLENGRTVHVHGMSFADPHAPESLLPHFHPPVADAINIGMLHTSLAGSAGHDPYAPCSVADLERHGYDYWALGHVHQRQVHSVKPSIVMPGMPQGRDINESGVKGITLVTIDDDGAVALEERPVGAAVFERVSIDLTATADWRDMLDVVGRHLALLRRGLPEADLILRITLTGTTPLSWRLRRDFDLLQGELANIAAGFGRCWVEKVETLFAGCSQHANRIAVDPIGELTALVENEVLSAFAFRADMRAVAEELLPHLPAELRRLLAADEGMLDDLVENAALSGSADVLSHLHGRGAVEGID
ncbi:metallophosphoesterase family protein [Sinorhizobium fredii]|uniref:DNA repair exonuclease n=1 Tax=Rhizobium fredii TaxID=380 RepID=M4Q2Q8_RHIFR|nr:exonuclease SbcCD subunit D [Sinorhizobium fredii]AGH09910.1 type III effector NopBF [Sinorhizobium fredii]AWM24480.1 DNA repair exonuclease family protein YhaO [Sinorhizobium fredii CCBAU 25509]MQW97630.1 DNA repair exonuclease [Sinorhizobium fredii]MQX12202.1 DNA repair exonuclease [Sinorhizobium fredii]UTY48892.1 exonuclease SbcCD subunit D [Sinorhizobium fredii]